ncbi:MAG: protein kinase [Burkholderiales bacterium]|nr:protein kinase [Burkholderiales bacterium]
MTESANAFPDALPPGTRLDDFVVTGVIGAGGFGTVYLAREETLDRTVAIKEYLPSAIAARAATHTVVPRSQGHREGFTAGLHSFLREARLQAQFSHPALLEVYRVWEQNGTAYMAMRYYPGTSLRELRKSPDAVAGYGEEQIRSYLQPVCDAVRELHEQNVLHRDVSPDNILIMPNGAPVLLDFGAARTVVAGATQSLTTVLKPGYAPIEQYADDGSLEQGPWTDVYGLGAVMYFLTMGGPPPQAVNRMMFDSLTAFDDATRGRYSALFIAAVKRALAVRPEDRFRSVAALCAALGWSARSPVTRLQTHIVRPADAGADERDGTSARPTGADTTGSELSKPPQPTPERFSSMAKPQPTASAAATTPAPPSPTGRRRSALVVALALLCAGGLLWWLLQRPGSAVGRSSDAPPAVAPTTPTRPTESDPSTNPRETSVAPGGGAAAPPTPPTPPSRTESSATPPAPATFKGPAPTVSSDAPKQKSGVERKRNADDSPLPDTAAERDTVAAPVAAPRPSRDADCDRLMAKLSLGTVDLTEAEHARLRACR